MRGGTTALHNVLCTSPDTHPLIAECQYLNAQLELYGNWATRFDPFLQDYFSNTVQFAEFTKHIVDEILSAARRNLGVEGTLVLKSPTMTKFFPLLAKFIPNAKFVVSLRDPKDTISSVLDVIARQQAQNQNHSLMLLGRDMAKHCQHFMSYYVDVVQACQVNEAGLAQRVLYSRYEELVQNTDETIAKLSEFCGVRLDRLESGDATSESKAGIGDKAHPVFGVWQTELSGKALSPSSVGRYRDALTDSEIAEIDRLYLKYRNLFGY
jgi:hypothetical protein